MSPLQGCKGATFKRAKPTLSFEHPALAPFEHHSLTTAVHV
ncbi:MAG: hypothetical protein ACJARN_000161 [Arenicella sp.]|jgi:hypothetical protein